MGFPFDWRDGRGSCSKDRQGGLWNLVWSTIVNCQIFEASDKQSCSGRYFTENIQGVFSSVGPFKFPYSKGKQLKAIQSYWPKKFSNFWWAANCLSFIWKMFLGIKEKFGSLIQIVCGTVHYRLHNKEHWWTNTDQVFRSFLLPLQTRKTCAHYIPFSINRCLASVHQLPTLVSKQETSLFRWQCKQKKKRRHSHSQ